MFYFCDYSWLFIYLEGILATNTPGVLTETTADVAFGLLISAARRFHETSSWIRRFFLFPMNFYLLNYIWLLHSGGWKEKMSLIDLHMGVDVSGTTLGIVGMGRIGQVVFLLH